MTKNKKFKNGFNSLLLSAGILFMLFCYTFAQAQSLGRNSVIETIQNAFKSITKIEAKNTVFRKVPGQGLRVQNFQEKVLVL